VDNVVLEVARTNPTDGSRMVAALASRELAGGSVNRQARAAPDARAPAAAAQALREPAQTPGYFQVTRPDELWHLDMTSVWVVEHGWCYLNAAIDCCTREITAWSLDVRCRAAEAIAVIDTAVAARSVARGTLTLGTDNGTAFTSRAFCGRLARARDHAPPRRLSRPREPGIHRVVVLNAQAALRLARGVRDPHAARGRGPWQHHDDQSIPAA
jgi:transposase InsO family protein